MMKKLTIVFVCLILGLVSLFMLFVTKKKSSTNNTIFLLPDTEDLEKNLTQTCTYIRHHPFPKDLNITRKLLEKHLGGNVLVDGKFKYSSIYVKRFEQLGNNFMQLSNTVYLSEVMNVSTIYIPEGFCLINNPITTSKGIKIIPTNETPSDAFVSCSKLFLMLSDKYCTEDRVYEFASEVLKSIPKVKINKYGLYIHIRSGDIFKENPCALYGQPPLCFYESIIEKWGFNDIYILSQDTKNPVINSLVQRYDAKLIVTDLPRTIGYILNAKNLVMSFGTFMPSLLKLIPEDPEKRIFRYGNNFYFNRAVWKKFFFTGISKYYQNNLLNNNWNNTEEQRNIMLNETCGDEWKISMYTNYSY